MYTENNTLAKIVLENFKASYILENYNLNYSTEGKRTLKEACNLSGLNPKKILKDIIANNNHGANFLKISSWEIDFLSEYIESNHHSYVRKVFPVINSNCKILAKNKKIGSRMLNELTELKADFETHMQKEERLIFPYIKRMNKIHNEKTDFEIPPFGSISNLIKVMEKEHHVANKALMRIRESCNNFKVKADDDLRLKNLYCYLKEFETDFNFHIHLENNLLFPNAVVLEKKLKKISKLKYK